MTIRWEIKQLGILFFILSKLFTIGSKAEGNKTKEMNCWSLILNEFYLSLSLLMPSMNFNDLKLANYRLLN